VFLGLLPLIVLSAAIAFPAVRRVGPDPSGGTSAATMRERAPLAIVLAVGTGLLLAGMTSGQPVLLGVLGFLGAVLRRGGLRTDGLALHPYQIAPKGRKTTGVSATPAIKRLLRSLARSRKFRTYSGGTVPIYYTEFAVIKGYGGIRTEAQRASRTVSDFKYMKRQGIKQIIWYHLVIYPSTVRDGFPSGIVNTNGTAVPTYNALVKARRSW